MQPIEQSVIASLNAEIEELTKTDEKLSDRERAAKRIKMALEGIARRLGLEGEVKMFGSFSNGFKTGSSDIDIVFVGSVASDQTVSLLKKFADSVQDIGFENVTKIFQANVPLAKFTDRKSHMEVDFCLNNLLGVRNSQLLYTYNEYDHRILQLGRMVKDWAKRHDLVGTADGLLNSYAYMLLVLHFLLSLPTPVAQNLQRLNCESVKVADSKWGCEDYWETKFFTDISSLERSENKMTVSELLIRFFTFYCNFDWHLHAVCMRLAQPGTAIDKYSLATPTNDEQWYVEDPFDLKHNLAGKCTRAGRKRILDEMRDALAVLSKGGKWSQVCPTTNIDLFYLKCRISPGVTPQALLEEFEEFDLVKLHFPKSDGSGRMGQAFLEFNSAYSRRRAHTKNESYVADCQLQLHYSSQHSLAEAIGQGHFSTYEMASYKMQRQVLAARVNNLPLPGVPQRPEMMRPPHFQDGSGHMPPGHNMEAYTAYPFGLGPPPPPPPLPHGQPPGQKVMPQHPPMQQGWGDPHAMAQAQAAQAAHMAASTPGMPKQIPGMHPEAMLHQQFQQHQQHQQHQKLQEQQQQVQRKAQAEMTPAPKVAGRVPEARMRAEAAKASPLPPKGRTEVRAPIPAKARTEVQAASSKTGWPGAAAGGPADQQGWFSVPISADSAKTLANCLSAKDKAVLQDFLQKWPHDQRTGGSATVVQVPLAQDTSGQQGSILPKEDWKRLQDLQSWLGRYKSG
mmetsp:Transcript_23026/g.48988  ORF Transcript_23026/g.48988 Transcript_23026/m.48988 type:complete len:735 (+) Transcript_23026:129-2333(+)